MTTLDLPAPGPAATDEQLSAWRDAVTIAGLPDPSRSRWQVLRAGVIGLWEFDVAEYWFADGRAQFVGQNQSGKSTMMALTTLLMLAGSLDRKYVDTFGDSEKEYRYYVEPVIDDRDRRDASTSTNRGWAWVEYGRIGPLGTPEFFTTMLYTQTKRGVKQMTRAWVVCHGTARVRDGLDLAVGQAVSEPKELEGIAGVTVYPKGSDYTERLATDLFGFDDIERYATVIEMLKVLRTPHLGQKLDPAWFTSQIRSALPPVAKSEVTELANGWQELEQLARDRDHADEARKAITVYLNRAWRPWADAVLRLHADTLIAADTAFVKAGDDATAAEETLEQARARLDDEAQNTINLEKALGRTHAEQMQLLRSSAYTTAVERANDAKRLRAEANATTERARKATAQLATTRGDLEKAIGRRDKAADELTIAQQEVETAGGHAVEAATAAGLGERAPAWAAAGDVDRFDVAITSRRGQVAALRKLIRAASTAAATWNTLDDLAAKAEAELTTRTDAATATESALHQAVQTLSDDLERWVSTLDEWAPPTETRTQWITAVTNQTRADRPRELLTALLTRQWLDPVTSPLITRAADLRAAAKTATTQASAADAEADHLAAAGDPIPDAPARWTRRTRPAFPAAAGAPLWRLLDPVDGLDPAVLDHVEAALAAAGLLDTWVTTDGTFSPEHGDDAVITTGTLPTATTSLAAVLQPAEDAATLTDAVTKILNGIGYTIDGPLTATVCLAADGRWRTTAAAGRAAPAEHGAEFIGTAARAATRRRNIADLRAQATAFRDEAQRLTGEADTVSTQVTNLRTSARQAPTDADVVAAAAAHTAATGEAEKADTAYRDARGQEEQARTLSEEKAAEVIRYGVDNQLPTSEEHLDTLAADLDTTAAAAGSLRLALRGLKAATAAATDAAERLTTEECRVTAAVTLAEDEAAAAELADTNATLAEQSVDADAQQLFAQAEELERKVGEYGLSISASRRESLARSKEVGEAENAWNGACKAHTAAGEHRDVAAAAWWTPVDAGLTAARNLPAPDSRDLPAALAHARTATERLRPPMWPDRLDDKAKRVEAALSRMLGSALIELRTVLEAHGGRSIIITEADDQHPLPSVTLIVDASGTSLDPAEAILHLQKLVDDLSRTHDEKLHQMYTELLSSTFIDHLADRMKKVITLLKVVNEVLEKHPTGANKTTLRLRRVPAEGQAAGFKILKALLDGTIESDAAQQQIQLFLGARLREAQEAGLIGTEDWTDRLAELLDYRAWFDVVAQYKVGHSDDDENRWKDLTRKVHGVDSGGGKVVTLLQPLLATLVALYSESPEAPRPLWLDEAFEGVDPGNRATMMRMLTDFDLDFLLAGPAPLVAVAQVPAAAVWVITRAPAPIPGVDLSLMLWAGHTLEQIPVGDYATRLLTPRRSAEDLGPDLFATMLTDPAPVEPPHTNGAHHTGTEEASDAAGINESTPA